MYGINIDPLNPFGRPEPSFLKETGFSWVRMVARPNIEWYHDKCLEAGLNTLVVLARESFPVWNTYRDQSANYALRLKATAFQIGNEPDCLGESSWTLFQDSYRQLVIECTEGIRRYSSATIVGAGLASGQPDWWRDFPVDAVAVHPYNKDTEQARGLLLRYKEYNKPLWVTEWNRPAWEIQDFLEMLTEETEVSFWFCFSDEMVNGFGLFNSGQPKPEYWALREAIRVMGQLSDKVKLLETQQALTTAVLKLILQGRWAGEWPHAEGFIKAIDPNDTNWKVALPKI
jgi:hypothetical protein